MAEKHEVKVKEVQNEEQARVAKKSSAPWPLITIGIVATVIILALVAGGWAYLKAGSQQRSMDRFGSMSQNDQSMSGQRGMRGGGMRGGAGRMDMSAIRGVITAIDGDTLTVSGSGKQVTVKKTNTTTISGDRTTVAVNDTVVITGDTASDGTVTATRIVIRNQSVFEGASSDDSQNDGSDMPSA